MNKIKTTAENTFYQLIVVYTLLVILISFNLFWKYTLHFEFFALILGILGIVLVWKMEDVKIQLNKKVHYFLLGLAIFLIILFRTIPYFNNEIPLGYDAGIYKYGIETFSKQGFSSPNWVLGAFSPLFLYFMTLTSWFLSSQFILTYLFIFFNIALGLSIYFLSKEYFGKTTGIIAFFLYALSLIQFKVFTLMYYKNVMALSLMLWALYFFKKEKRFRFIAFSVLTGAMHLPTFYIFGLAYFVYAFISPINNNNKRYNLWLLKNNIINGILILILTLIFYLGFIHQAILPLIYPVAESFISPGNSPGTFVSFFTYQFSTLAYLPFAILGFFALAKRKQFNMLFFWTLITAIIVYFQFFFFNRFIIHLDIALIILAGKGFSILIENKKKLGFAILVLMLLSAGFVTYQESVNAQPLISKTNLYLIQKLHETEENSSVIAISSEYSPWVLAYSERKTIAPGLFDENKWSREQWEKFWTTTDKNETREMLLVYEKPIYLFAGTKSFNNSCFSGYLEESGGKIYKYDC